ncbi:MAG: hypothetical protein L3J19_09865 [Sulfurimonas sp.]|nr:hypothetical protein [Sulfurimonas sp.]
MSPQWIVVIGLIAIVYFFFIKKRPTVQNSNKKNDNSTPKDEVQSNDMVECSTCGVYCEVSDAILSNNKYYCSNECLEKE